MNHRHRSLSSQQPPTFTRIVGLVTGALLGVVALVIGSVFFLIVLGVSLVAAAFIYVRMWWLKRQLARSNANHTDSGQANRQQYHSQTRSGGHVLDAEYTVVSDKKGSS